MAEIVMIVDRMEGRGPNGRALLRCGAGIALALCAQASGAANPHPQVPSGIEVSYHDRIVEEQADGQIWLTLRFLAPQIGAGEGEAGYDRVVGDLDHLCDAEGMPAAAEAGGVDQIIITLMDRIVERGVMDPEATMYIGAYLPAEGGCVWE
ncbi:DUF6497 family protein [Tropicimonas sp.]|uniref:DUF6497 family protein n=1 Tax=Tropicimonas sp. TaxID=2067044 RepID=UPI003A8709AA